MDYAVSPGGLLVHSRKDWPCAVCRSSSVTDGRGLYLCVDCARGLLAAAGAGVESARALLDDVTDALVLLEGASAERRVTVH